VVAMVIGGGETRSQSSACQQQHRADVEKMALAWVWRWFP